MAEINKQKDIVIEPHKGFQTAFASSNVDIVFSAGTVNNGKSFALVLAQAEPLMTDPDFRGLLIRRALQNLKAGGGFADTFKDIFGEYVSIKMADSPRVSFPSGAFCDLTYIDDSNLDKMRERAKGWQYDVIGIDEITEMPWSVFTYLLTRNRGRSKTFSGHFFAAFNPKRRHWTRTFVDWYVNPDGSANLDRIGRVRYFYITGETENDVVWGNSKEEVYAKCRITIDRQIKSLGGKFNYENFIKSFVLYTGTMAENSAMMDKNPDYVGSVAASGGKTAQQLLEMNFNADPDEEANVPIPLANARMCFENDPQVNGEKWVTVDLADVGTDNVVALAWNGFHVVDILILPKSTPKQNIDAVKAFATRNGVGANHIIYDATAARYFNDGIPEAIPYISIKQPFGSKMYLAASVKDMCYLRLVEMIKRGNLTFADEVARKNYTHANLKFPVSVENEFIEECSVVRFDIQPNGKSRLWNKKKMNQNLGKGRSMDLLDPCAMRMLPCAGMEYGEELEAGAVASQESERQEAIPSLSIYDETLWY